MPLTSFQTLAQHTRIDQVLKDHQKYLAHTPDETLHEHIELVKHYFLSLVEAHNLESRIDKVILELAQDNTELANFIKALFWETVFFHDFGKVNENFQHDKMENTAYFPSRVSNDIQSQHSILSCYIFLVNKLSEYQKSNLSEKTKQLVFHVLLAFAHNIMRHHASKLDDLTSGHTYQRLTQQLCDEIRRYTEYYNITINENLLQLIPNIIEKQTFKNFPYELFALTRLNFSLLTAADYYATAHFMGGWPELYQEFGTLSLEDKGHINNSIKNTEDHNAYLYHNREAIYNTTLDTLQEKSTANLNKLRSKMAAEVLTHIKEHHSENLFYIEAPTGGGKTNLSMIAANELLQADESLNKVFYVFPFTTLITQTQKSVKSTYNLSDDQLIELHSKAGFKEKEEQRNDGLYGTDHLNQIHNQFANFPVTLLTHIKFFDILKANHKDSIYLMHRLANSVVVIDEVQAYNPMLWDKMAYLIEQYADALNIRFVIMSATLPKIGNLINKNFTYLISDAIERYFKNPNFGERVTFDDSLMPSTLPEKDEKEDYLDQLAHNIREKAVYYRSKNGSVRLIVEFIFKNSASQFANVAENIFSEYKILLLSGTILEPRRREIINYLKNPAHQNENILLITTQVVEAGVDIDMDLGFKDSSLIDSEEQLAGRVNRNVKGTDNYVYLFNMDKASVIYGKDLRFKEIGKIEGGTYLDILNNKRFDDLYDKVKAWLDASNQNEGEGGNLNDYKNAISSLNFPKVDDEFKLINQENISVFVPIKLSRFIEGGNGNQEAVFTDQQIRFLQNMNIDTNGENISGADVFEVYRQVIRDNGQDFNEQERNIKILQGIISLFTFSLFAESKVAEKIKSGGDWEEYGFLYLDRHEEIYDYKYGIQDHKMDGLIFL